MNRNLFQPECQYKLYLYDIDQCKISEIDIVLKLEDHGPHFILKKETIGKKIYIKFNAKLILNICFYII